MQKEILGVDIGGVIIDRVNDGTDTSFFGENYLRTSAVPGAFETLRQLVDKRFLNQVFLVSKCGKKTEEKTREWLQNQNFFATTGILSDHLRFCRERHDKAGICEELGITHFVDDRLEVLSYLTTVSKLFLFQPQENEVRRFAQYLPRVQRVESWQEIREELLQ